MKSLFSAWRYLIYLIKGRNEHAVHSPFVFDLLLNVIYNDKNYYSYQKVEALRQEMLENEKVLEFRDHGAGKKGAGSGEQVKRKVKDIAHRSLKSPKYAQLLFRLADHFQPKQILELGTSLGITTSYLALANSSSRVFTLEGATSVATIAKSNFEKLELNNIEQIIGNFDDTLQPLLDRTRKQDFVFFDGNHEKEATLRYFDLCLKNSEENSVFIFDDIYWSPGMMQAWEEIKKNERVKVTIDLFHLGIVFFRKEQVKQDFIIRF